jgi:hypothetical protein
MTLNQKIFNLKKEIGAISKDANNPYFKSKYISLDSLLEQIAPYLDKYQLDLRQPIKLDHDSGREWVSTYFIDLDTDTKTAPSEKFLKQTDDPQKEGSSITYYRRYTLLSKLGLRADLDDDGNAAKPTSTSNKLPWLNRGTSNYKKVVAALKGGNYTLDDVLKKYQINKELKAELSEL